MRRVTIIGTGGAGVNITSDVRQGFTDDLKVTPGDNEVFAQVLTDTVRYLFLDTNIDSLNPLRAMGVTDEEILLMGEKSLGGCGSYHDKGRALKAYQEVQEQVHGVIDASDVVIPIGSGGKGTGLGTFFALCEYAAAKSKVLIPFYIEPALKVEVDPVQHEASLQVIEDLKKAGIRFIHIQNRKVFSRDMQMSKLEAWGYINHTIARGIRGLLPVLWDRQMVDLSDLARMLGGHGRLRLGFSEIKSKGKFPCEDEIKKAAAECVNNPFYGFNGSPATSIISISGSPSWPGHVEGRIREAISERIFKNNTDSRFRPLPAYFPYVPRPWGITALFAEWTGVHEPLKLAAVQRTTNPLAGLQASAIRNSFRSASTLLPTDLAPQGEEAAASDAQVTDRASAQVTTLIPTPPGLVPPSPRSGASPALPPHGGATVTPTPLRGAATASPPHLPPSTLHVAAQSDVDADTPWTFDRFMKGLGKGDLHALDLASNGVGLKTVPVTHGDMRKWITQLVFRQALNKNLSDDWKAHLYECATSVPVTDWELPRARLLALGRIRRLSTLTPRELADLKEETFPSEEARADLRYLKAVLTVFGEEALKACLEPTQPSVAGGLALQTEH